MNVPFLNSAPAPLMYVSRVRDIMHQGVVHLPELCHIGELTMLWKRLKKKKLSHNAFPVLETGNTGLLKGLLSKKEFFTLMEDLKDPAKKEHMLTGPNHNLIDVMDYADRSPITVFPHTTVARAYSIFRKLGLRHCRHRTQRSSVRHDHQEGLDALQISGLPPARARACSRTSATHSRKASSFWVQAKECVNGSEREDVIRLK